MGRNCIVTATGVLYATVEVGEDRVKVSKSVDNGYTWTLMHTFQDLLHCEGLNGDGGICLYLDYSEVDDVLYIIYLEVVATDIVPRLYDVTNKTLIGSIGAGTFDCHGGRFACAGHIDRKMIIAWSDENDTNKLKATLVDINHYNSGARDMVLDAGGTVDTGSEVGIGGSSLVGIFDVSEVDDGFWLWWVAKADGKLWRKKISVDIDAEDFTSAASVSLNVAGPDDVVTELFGCESSVLFTKVDTVTPANTLLGYFVDGAGGSDTIATIEGATGTAGEDGGQNYAQYYWPQMVYVTDGGTAKFQAFFMARNGGDTYNQLETVEIVASTGATGTGKIVTGSLASPWSLRNKCFCVFEPPNRTQGDINGRRGILVAIGNGDIEGFGHRHGNCSIYTEWLGNNAYPLAITSTIISSAPADYHGDGDRSEHERRMAQIFATRGIPLLVLKYELTSDPQVRSRLAYGAPTEIEINGFINELSLKNPTNIRLEDSEVFKDVREKDIRSLYFPADTYLARTFKRARRGFVMRTVYLLKFYGRFYEITQIVPVFGKNGITCNKANLYVVGARYDPFTRKVLPNEI